MATWPHSSTPPWRIELASRAGAVASPRYLAATALNAGPATAFCGARQPRQALAVYRACKSMAPLPPADFESRAVCAASQVAVSDVTLVSLALALP